MGNFKYYTKGDKQYIRISSILEPLTQHKYKSIPKDVLDNAADLGTQIHTLIEKYCDGIELKVNKDYVYYDKMMNCFNQYKEVSKDWVVIGNEITYYNDELLIAGTIDMLAMINNNQYLIDLKTRASIYSKDDFVCEMLQVILYKKIFNLDCKLGILILNKGHKTKYLFKEITKKQENMFNSILDLLIKLALNK